MKPPPQKIEVIEKDQRGFGNVLLVLDEARALALRGYTVTQAASGEEALEVLNIGKDFDIYVTDVVMLGKNGPTWVREAMESQPNAKVAFVSGYAEAAFQKGDPEIPNSVFLAKPFSLVELTQKVKEQLDA